MRSEAISSSRIEGITPTPDKVVPAELAAMQAVRGFKENAEAVARHLVVLKTLDAAGILRGKVIGPDGSFG